MKLFREMVKNMKLEESLNLGCMDCDRVSSKRDWQLNEDICPKCKSSTRSIVEDKKVTDDDEKEEKSDETLDDTIGSNGKKLSSLQMRAKFKAASTEDLTKLAQNDGEGVSPSDIQGRLARKELKSRPATQKESLQEKVTPKQLQDIEKFADRILAKYKVDIGFSKHFADRMNDSRNSPDITVADLQQVFKKIAKKKAMGIRTSPDSEAVIKDLQKDLNMPIVIRYNKQDDEFDVVTKTIMRKKNFKTSSKVITTESSRYDTRSQRSSRNAERNAGIENEPVSSYNTNSNTQYGIYVNGKPFKIQGKHIVNTNSGTLEKTIRTLMSKPFNKGKNFTVSPVLNEKKDKDDPCWKNYEMVGMKKKNGKDVPNCVPMEKISEGITPKMTNFGTDVNCTNGKIRYFAGYQVSFMKDGNTIYILSIHDRNFMFGFAVVPSDIWVGADGRQDIEAYSNLAYDTGTPTNNPLRVFNKVFYVGIAMITKMGHWKLVFAAAYSKLTTLYARMVKNKAFLQSLDSIGWAYKGENEDGFVFTKQKIIEGKDTVREKKDEDDPCWKNYEMIGMKKKNGKDVPNCVPIEKKT
jgi:hypothetical protein